MSNLIVKRVQLGQSNTATNNFSLEVPTVPDGTIILGRGLAGATTSTVLKIDASGNFGVGTIPSGTYKLEVSGAASATNLALSGNVAFSGTGNRITGDFSNATASNRVMFQSSTVNNNTYVGVLPNGTSTTSLLEVYNSSDISNASRFNFQINSTEATVRSSYNGTGTFLPLTFYTGNTERLRITESTGNVGIGTANPDSLSPVFGSLSKLGVYNGSGIASLTIKGTGNSNWFSNISLGSDETTDKEWYVSHSNSGLTGINSLAFSYYNGTTSNILMTVSPNGSVNIGNGTPLGKFSVGDGAGVEQIVINGGNTASGDGASLSIYNNGTIFGGIGNHSAVFGGAYSSVIDVHGYSGIDFYTTGLNRLSIGTSGQIGIGGATYGTAGQVLTSGGPSAAPTWATVSGVGGSTQTWQNVSGSRVSGTTYTNSTGAPIMVLITAIHAAASGSASITPIVGGVTLPTVSGAVTATSSSDTMSMSFIVPNTMTYSATYSGTSGTTWYELR